MAKKKEPYKSEEPFNTAYRPIKAILLRHGEDVAGAALLKVDAKLALSLTDTTDQNLWRVYKNNMRDADKTAESVEHVVDEYLSGVSNAYAAIVLSRAFFDAFGHSYGEWRKSLSLRGKTV